MATDSLNIKRANKIKRTVQEIIFDSLNYLLLIVIAFVTLYPFWYVLVLSFNEGMDASLGGIWFWPRKFTALNYYYVLVNSQMKTAYLNTIIRTVLGSLITLTVCTLAAFSMSKRNLKGRGILLAFFMIPMFIGGTLISQYVIYAKIGFLDNFLVYILPGSFSFFYMVIIRTFIYGIPPELEESATIDGAGYFTVFVRIILPLCKPVLATILLYAGVSHWLDFGTNLFFVRNEKLMVLQYLLYEVVRSSRLSLMSDQAFASTGGGGGFSGSSSITSEAIKMTTLMVATLPILFVYPFVQKYFVKGMMIGAIKG